MTQTLETVVRNRRKLPVLLYEMDGLLAQLAPGEVLQLESAGPGTILSRWAEVIFYGEDELRLVERDGWTAPDGDYCETVNAQGAPVERRSFGGREVWLQRGLPAMLPWSEHPALSGHRRVEIRRILKKEKSQHHPGYVSQNWPLMDVFIDQSEAKDEQGPSA